MPLDGTALASALSAIQTNHYTRSIPSGKRVCFAFGECIILFAIPANPNISTWLLGARNRVWELARLWAPDGHAPNLLTQGIAAATKEFHRLYPEVEALVSYADPNAGHLGGVYRAASWVSLGQCEEVRTYRGPNGEFVARRKFHSGHRSLRKAEIEALGYKEEKLPGKYRFARGLSRKARRAIAARAG